MLDRKFKRLRLKEMRILYDIDAKEIADFIGISSDAYYWYESGNAIPDVEKLFKIADFYECDVSYFAEYECDNDNDNELHKKKQILLNNNKGIDILLSKNMKTKKEHDNLIKVKIKQYNKRKKQRVQLFEEKSENVMIDIKKYKEDLIKSIHNYMDTKIPKDWNKMSREEHIIYYKGFGKHYDEDFLIQRNHISIQEVWNEILFFSTSRNNATKIFLIEILDSIDYLERYNKRKYVFESGNVYGSRYNWKRKVML